MRLRVVSADRKKPRGMPGFLLLAVVACASFGCGQSGPLTLPERGEPAAAPADAAAATEPEPDGETGQDEAD